MKSIEKKPKKEIKKRKQQLNKKCQNGKRKPKGKKSTKEETKQNPVCLSKKKKKKKSKTENLGNVRATKQGCFSPDLFSPVLSTIFLGRKHSSGQAPPVFFSSHPFSQTPTKNVSSPIFSLLYIYIFSSSLKSTQPNITLVFNAPPLIIHVRNAIIFQIEKEKKFRRKKKKKQQQQRDQRGEAQDNKLQHIVEMATHFSYL